MEREGLQEHLIKTPSDAEHDGVQLHLTRTPWLTVIFVWRVPKVGVMHSQHSRL